MSALCSAVARKSKSSVRNYHEGNKDQECKAQLSVSPCGNPWGALPARLGSSGRSREGWVTADRKISCACCGILSLPTRTVPECWWVPCPCSASDTSHGHRGNVQPHRNAQKRKIHQGGLDCMVPLGQEWWWDIRRGSPCAVPALTRPGVALEERSWWC